LDLDQDLIRKGPISSREPRIDLQDHLETALILFVVVMETILFWSLTDSIVKAAWCVSSM